MHLPTINSSQIVSATVGLAIGLTPVTGEAMPIFLSCVALVVAIFGKFDFRSVTITPIIAPAVYLLGQFLLNWYHLGVDVFGSPISTYLLQIVMLGLFFSLFYSRSLDHKTVFQFLFYALIMSIVLLGMNFLLRSAGACRVSVATGNPQWVAAFLAIMVMPTYLYSTRHHVLNGRMQVALLTLALVAIGAFAGARMSFYAFLAMSILMLAVFLAQRNWIQSKVIILSLVLGVTSIVAIDQARGCNFSNRVFSQFIYSERILNFLVGDESAATQAVEERLSTDKNPPKPAPAPAKPKTAPDTVAKPTPSAPAAPKPAVKPKPVDEVGAILSAGASRAAVWRNAATAIQAAPILGYGQLAERTLVVQNFPQLAHLTHAHNQFLSWLLWGGLVGFGLGLVFLFANQISGNRSLAANVVSVGMVFLFFSETLLSSFNLNGFLLVYALVYYLDKQKSHQS